MKIIQLRLKVVNAAGPWVDDVRSGDLHAIKKITFN